MNVWNSGLMLVLVCLSTGACISFPLVYTKEIQCGEMASEKEGIKLCFYHSITDWYHPDAQAPLYPDYNAGQKDQSISNPQFPKYFKNYLKPQVKELLTKYGDIGVMWFDGEWISDYTTEMSKWLKVNGEAIYGTKFSPFGKLSWGRCPQKVEKGNTALYFSIFDWPTDGKLVLPKFTNKVIKSTLLSNGEPVKTSSADEGLRIELPPIAPDSIAIVVKIIVKGMVDIQLN